MIPSWNKIEISVKGDTSVLLGFKGLKFRNKWCCVSAQCCGQAGVWPWGRQGHHGAPFLQAHQLGGRAQEKAGAALQAGAGEQTRQISVKFFLVNLVKKKILAKF